MAVCLPAVLKCWHFCCAIVIWMRRWCFTFGECPFRRIEIFHVNWCNTILCNGHLLQSKWCAITVGTAYFWTVVITVIDIAIIPHNSSDIWTSLNWTCVVTSYYGSISSTYSTNITSGTFCITFIVTKRDLIITSTITIPNNSADIWIIAGVGASYITGVITAGYTSIIVSPSNSADICIIAGAGAGYITSIITAGYTSIIVTPNNSADKWITDSAGAGYITCVITAGYTSIIVIPNNSADRFVTTHQHTLVRTIGYIGIYCVSNNGTNILLTTYASTNNAKVFDVTVITWRTTDIAKKTNVVIWCQSLFGGVNVKVWNGVLSAVIIVCSFVTWNCAGHIVDWNPIMLNQINICCLQEVFVWCPKGIITQICKFCGAVYDIWVILAVCLPAVLQSWQSAIWKIWCPIVCVVRCTICYV